MIKSVLCCQLILLSFVCTAQRNDFIELQGFDPSGKYRRGKSYEITWKANNTNPITIELYKADQRITGVVNIPNNGSYTFHIPAFVEKGKDYKFKFSETANPEATFYSPEFKVRSKIPLALKIAPAVAVVAVLYILVKRETQPDKLEGMPLPVFPPDSP